LDFADLLDPFDARVDPAFDSADFDGLAMLLTSYTLARSSLSRATHSAVPDATLDGRIRMRPGCRLAGRTAGERST